MKILVVCEFNQNRSVTLAGQLKWLGNDVLTAGIATQEPETLEMLLDWADLVIPVDKDILAFLDEQTEAHNLAPDNVQLWNIGPDTYPRPYNKDLLQKCKELLYEHPEVDNRPLTKSHPEKGIKDPRRNNA